MCLLAMFSCAGPKYAIKKPPVNERPPVPKEEQVKVFDPATGTYVLVPRSTVKLDTIKWTQDTPSPLVTDKVTESEQPNKQNNFQISLLMPFTLTSDIEGDDFNGKVNRFLQYYGGVQLALSEVDSGANTLSLHAFDVDGSLSQTQAILNDPAVQRSDVIVGPYDREEIENVASYGLKHETMVVSPWLPAFNIGEENPYFIQVNPGLSTHADAITSFIVSNWPGKKVFLVARDYPAEINRLNLFKKNSELNAEDLIIRDDSPDMANTDLQTLLSDEGTIFILPYYASADEGFVNSFLRKLHADKDIKEVMVFGMPQWLGFANLNPNYLESLSVHISVSTYIDPSQPDYNSFREKYFDRYHTVPDLQAFLGYDLIKWISNTLVNSGKEGLIGPSSAWLSGIASGFDIRPVFRNSDISTTAEMKTPMYYENTRIRILKYEGQDFHLVQ